MEAVASGGPADRAGLRAGDDVIVGVAGRQVSSPDDLAQAIADRSPGDARERRRSSATATAARSRSPSAPARSGATAVSFASPGFLLRCCSSRSPSSCYLRLERAGGAGSRAAFATPGMLDSVAPVRPGWRRHAPMWLYGVAVAVLAVALARPQATVAVPVERASVVLAIDESGSMQAQDVQPSRLEAARSAARDFVDKVPAQPARGHGDLQPQRCARRRRPPPTAPRCWRRSTRCARAAGPRPATRSTRRCA